jgi:dimeric dUTPase (all-alpha-NTP-PPase superfamily)
MIDLEDLFEKQRHLIAKIREDKPEFFLAPEPFEGYRIYMLASFLQHECEEFKMETKWKWWKAKENYNIDKENRKVEIADMWHVLMQLTMEVGMTPEDIAEAYYKKWKENFKRQEERY